VHGRFELAIGTRHRWGWRPAELVRPFLRRNVPFAVVGGVALSYYTHGRTTPADLDIVLGLGHRASTASSEAYSALNEIVGLGVVSGPPEFGAVAVREGVEMTFETARGTLHIVGRSAGSDSEEIVARRRWVWLDRTRLPLCQLSDLIALKERDRREKDVRDLDLLRGLGLTSGE